MLVVGLVVVVFRRATFAEFLKFIPKPKLKAAPKHPNIRNNRTAATCNYVLITCYGIGANFKIAMIVVKAIYTKQHKK